MSPKIVSKDEIAMRENSLIQIARDLIEKDCTTTVTMDKLVVAAPYSKGTIYKHFISKEDLLMAVCNTCMEEIKELFLRALQFTGTSREKALAVSVAYVIWAKLHPAQLFAVLSAHSPSVAMCSSEHQNEIQKNNEIALMGLLNSAIENAIEAGEFTLPENMNVDQVNFAMWSSLWGAMALIMSKGTSTKLQPMMFERESFTNTRLILDGLGWKPLSTEWDYSASKRKIARELFQPELDTLEEMGTPFLFA